MSCNLDTQVLTRNVQTPLMCHIKLSGSLKFIYRIIWYFNLHCLDVHIYSFSRLYGSCSGWILCCLQAWQSLGTVYLLWRVTLSSLFSLGLALLLRNSWRRCMIFHLFSRFNFCCWTYSKYCCSCKIGIIERQHTAPSDFPFVFCLWKVNQIRWELVYSKNVLVQKIVWSFNFCCLTYSNCRCSCKIGITEGSSLHLVTFRLMVSMSISILR